MAKNSAQERQRRRLRQAIFIGFKGPGAAPYPTDKPQLGQLKTDMTKSQESANRAAMIEEDTAAISQSRNAPNVIVSAPSSVSTSSSNTQPILSATPSALDYSDPWLSGS